MSDLADKPVLSNRQRRDLRKRIRKEQAAAPKPEPVAREVYEPAVARHEDDRVIPGLSGRGAIQRLDTLGKLWESGKITPQQYSAGRDYLAIVEHYFACASGLARLSEEAGRVGGDGDPIRRYLKGRPARKINGVTVGYIPTQRPRNPATYRPGSDGWTATKLSAMSEFSRMARLVEALPNGPRTALAVLVIDQNRPDLPALSIAAAVRRMYGYRNANVLHSIVRDLRAALDEIDGELMSRGRVAA